MGMRLVAVSVALGACAALASVPVRAQDAPPPGCVVGSVNLGPNGKGDFSVSCSGISEALGIQLTDINNRIVQNRLDVQAIIAKLGEVNQIPEEGVSRVVDDGQKQKIIQSLLGKPPQPIAITAHPTVIDSADVALGIATALSQVGWQIEGQQIKRMAPKLLDPVEGVAIVVKAQNSPPQKAAQLKAALAAANITAAYVNDPAMAPDAAMLWVGRRPGSNPDQPR